MRYDLVELKFMCQMNIGGWMETQQMCYYAQDLNHEKVGIYQNLCIQLSERQDTKVIYEQDEILLMVKNIREYQHTNELNVRIL